MDFLSLLGFSLMWVGVIITIAALSLASLTSRSRAEEKKEDEGKGKGRTEWGGIIFIGPFPIIFGSSRRFAMALAIVAVIAALFIIGFMILMLAS